MSLKLANQAPVGGVPDDDLGARRAAILSADRGEKVVIRTEGHVAHAGPVAAQGQEQRTGGDIPDFDALIVAGGCESQAIGRESDRVDGRGVPGERSGWYCRGQVQEHNRAISAGGRQQRAVGAEGDVADRRGRVRELSSQAAGRCVPEIKGSIRR